MTTPNNRVSMGRNYSEPWCKTCPHLKRDGNGWGGWCQHPSNRVFSEGWPQGFTPSQGSDGGCDLHPAAGVLVDARVLAENLYHIAMYGDRGNGEKLMDAIEDALATAGVPVCRRDGETRALDCRQGARRMPMR